MPSAARVYKQRRTAAREICVFWLSWEMAEPLALGGEGVKDLKPAGQRQHKVRVVLGLPGAQRIGYIVAHRILLRCSVKLTANHYTLRKMGRAELCRFYHHNHINNRLLTNASIIAQHFDYRR